ANDKIEAIKFGHDIHRPHDIMFISKMKKLSTPDFNRLPRLQKLELRYCGELEEIHRSLGNHRSLKYFVPQKFCLSRDPSKHGMLSKVGCDSRSDRRSATNLIYLSLLDCFSLNSTEVKFDGLKCLKEFKCSKGPEKTPFPLTLTRSLRKLDLSFCCFDDGDIQSDIGELSNLQDLNLSYNEFSKLHFSLSQLTRLKLLNLKNCKRLVKLPELPSSISIIIADGCDKLTTIGNLNENCKWLPLPENWCNDFCGFLICAVVEDHVYSWRSPNITIKEETSDDMHGMFHDVVWGESFGGKLTWVWYVSFASLRRTEWWNPTHKNVSFYMQHINDGASIGIGASLVPMSNGSGLTDTSTDSSEFTDDYTQKISILHDSKSSLIISPGVHWTSSWW
ncbi:Toll/interleukin-1 receptor domain-containing protein, partial [Tanacetum coccineum]